MSNDAVMRCQATAVSPLSGRAAWCELPAGHAGKHRAELAQVDAPPALMDWSDPPAGVWVYAVEYPHEGITQAVPCATEIEALRVMNTERNSSGRVVFVPFGADLAEVLR